MVPPKVLVLGGKGFIGRHAVAALGDSIAEVTIGTRSPESIEGEIEQRKFKLEERTSTEDWAEAAAEFDIILNCVGILRPRGAATYEKVHHLAPQAIAAACAACHTRFVHVSALALSPTDRSGFLVTKRTGEQAIQLCGGDWVIVRPSLLDGEGGYGAAWLRGVARLPVFAAPMDAQGKIAALTVSDLGEALTQLCLASVADLGLDKSRVFELGGNDAFTFEQYIRGLRKRYSQSQAIAVPIPGFVARVGAHLCDLMRATPFSFGHWELLRKDNVPSPNRLAELLGREPTQVIGGHLHGQSEDS